MRLIVKQNGKTINEYRFNKGPIYIGRHLHSQVFLRDRKVSRQHAVIFTSEDGQWMIEDLDSANKTILNDIPIHKESVKTGDCIKICDFVIDVELKEKAAEDTPIDLEDTLVNSEDPQLIIRTPNSERAPAIRLPAKRAKDFVRATEEVCKADGLDDVLNVLLHIASSQFTAWHAWCALRDEPEGPMICHSGRTMDGISVQIADLVIADKINAAIEKKQFMLMPKIPRELKAEKVQSVMIAPILSEAGCFGVLYIDNSKNHEKYSVGDLDYLMMLCIHTAVVIENF